jgi:4-hydroxy-3-methylbut-2-en-1-yl diphosphate reductase
MSRPLFAVPLLVEAALVRSGARGADVQRTGMGPAHARAAAARLLARPGERLLVVGFCGGLQKDAVPGEVVVADEVLAAADEEHAPLHERCAEPGRLADMLADEGLGVRRGTVVCVSRLALGERRAQMHAAGAIAVDMESVWLAEGAGQRPFDVVRVVLDSPSHELFSPRAPIGALRAARALRQVARALWRDGAGAPIEAAAAPKF